MSLLEQNTIRKEQMDQKFTKLEFEAGVSEEYKMKTIYDNTIYLNKAKSHLPSLYYLVAWKRYPEEENIWELSSTV